MRTAGVLCLALGWVGLELAVLYAAVGVTVATLGGRHPPLWLIGLAGLAIGRWVALYLRWRAV